MNKMISAILLLALSSVSLNAFSAKNKVDVCHKGKDISVSSKSLSAHMGHGDEEGECDDDSTDNGSDTMAAVVMMSCEAIDGNGMEVVSVSTSFEFASIDIEEPAEDCAVALADMLDAGFKLRSVTSASAGDSDDLSLHTNYLLVKKIEIEDS